MKTSREEFDNVYETCKGMIQDAVPGACFVLILFDTIPGGNLFCGAEGDREVVLRAISKAGYSLYEQSQKHGKGAN